MKNKIKIAVIGGTGKSGKYLVSELLKQGFELKVLVRNPDNFKLNSPLVEIVEGNVKESSSIYALLENCQAVISTLGLGIPASEPTIFSKSTSVIIEAMARYNIKRYIVTTGLNVDTPFDKKGEKSTLATAWMKKEYPISTLDKQLEYNILANSTIDWTLVRLPLIEQTEARTQVHASLEDCPGDKISATDLADFLIEHLFSKEFIRKAPFIANV